VGHRLIRILFVVATAVAVGAVAVSSAQAPKSVWDGVYSEAQALEGEAVYVTQCAECHGDDMAGIEQAPAVAGASFVEKWNKTSLRKLYETIEQMPPSKPKSLTAKQYTEALAYLLSANEFPPGKTALEADRSLLGAITLTTAKPGP
jgi:mono/diheme cytochrome c family protein